MPVQTSPNLNDLLRVFHAATDKGKITWHQTAAEETFRTDFGRGMVRIAKVSDAPIYILSLLDEEGILLDEFQSSREEEVVALENLHKKARRQALEGNLKAVYDHLRHLAGES